MLYLILNPNAHSKKDSQIRGRIRRVLEEASLPFRIYETGHKGHACELAQMIASEDRGAVIAVVGGDGTIHEVLNGIPDLSAVTLGVIPHGSGNDFVRGMGIPEVTDRALEAVIHPTRIVRMDVGRASCGGRTERFCVSAGIGFDASVCHEALASPIKNALNTVGAGKLAYTAIAAKQIVLYKHDTVRVRLDGNRTFTFPKTWFVAVMNQRFEGGGIALTPEADASDGILDVFIGSGVSKAELVTALPLARYGLHKYYRGIHFLRCRSVDILAAKNSPIHLDGESGGTGHILRAGLEAEKLKVIVS